MKHIRKIISTKLREYLNEQQISNNKKNVEVFFRKSRNPKVDIIRNFSCYHNAYFDTYDEALKYFKTEATFSQPITQDPITKKWCGHVESGLCGYIVRDEEDFNFAIDELTNFFPHIQDIEEISVFMSNDYYLEDGSDGEDTFRYPQYLFNIPSNISYDEYISKLEHSII
jgi:hypothetical protein